MLITYKRGFMYQVIKTFLKLILCLYVHVFYVLFDCNFFYCNHKFFNSFFRHSTVVDTECKMLHCRKGHSLSRYCEQIMHETNTVYREITHPCFIFVPLALVVRKFNTGQLFCLKLSLY